MSRIAISHDWMATPRGAERVLGEFCRVLTGVSVYTLFCDQDQVPDSVSQHAVYVSRLDRIPGIARSYRLFLPFFQKAIRDFHVEQMDLLLSISHSIAKAIPHAPQVPHVCYCLTPARYLWEPQLYGPALRRPWRQKLLDWAARDLKEGDLEVNRGVDHFVAISETIQQRIRQRYQRDSHVIYPCIDLDFYRRLNGPSEDFYLIVSALVPQKRLDLAVEAFSRNGRPLHIVGLGPSYRSLKRKAGENVSFLGWQSDETIRRLYNSARALIFPGCEDFGIVPVEAQACGCPVIAYRRGGVTETVQEGETGIFFSEATASSLNEAIRTFENCRFEPSRIEANAQRFSRPRFWKEWRSFLKEVGIEVG